MGNREDLLAGAKRCLYTKGYARTSIRDIATEAGVSMAAVGYHFGSKEALLNEAFRQATLEWSEEIGRALAGSTGFEEIWAGIIGSFTAHRALWAATFEVIGLAAHIEELRADLARNLADAREGLAYPFEDRDAPPDDRTRWAMGSLYQALLTGIMAQLLIDPTTPMTPQDITTAIHTIATTLPKPTGAA
ncbi:TetR/AcrR family transcriptional regulator [Actinocrispum sp. NPDC049592]|uniref:TetR/AcrR family transcriptional regulator n=1 Tax=Actinocrispum sp. NPDC049592 TaxID=3154835 RepID=UPI00342F9138